VAAWLAWAIAAVLLAVGEIFTPGLFFLGPVALAAEAALVRYVWKVAPFVSLAHDISDGGLEVALKEAARYSRLDAEAHLPSETRAGRVLLACAPENVERLGKRNVVQIGTVG